MSTNGNMNGGHVDSDMDDSDKPSADQMDEERRQAMAHEYLCRLEEARRWMGECLSEEDLPPSVDLEESLRNGVLLARLANFFAQDVVPLTKIFDREQTRYKTSGLHFRHTDNTVQWLRAMAYVRFPEVFFPDTTDVYDKKNMPKAIFCLHALSLYLYRMGVAPPIRDVAGKAAFTSRHTDNTVQWLRAMAFVRFPEVFFPDTNDVYDKKNMPKAIFCLHALSLYRMGVTPPICDVAGKAAFTSRHTDNTVQWLRAMAYVRFPEVFFPDTTDVYDKKNMPKAIFCLHALSLYLYRMGVAPPIRDVARKAAFTSRHTDNTVQWLRAMAYVRFPEVFFPDTTDIYDKKSMPKAIFCLHVLSLYLYGMGVALPICDVARKAAFTSRHTDNTVQWLRAMAYVRFPEVFFPDTTDVYDKKNMPKPIICLHALSLYLYRMGIAPPICDVAGKVAFTSRHMDNTVQLLRAMAYVRFPEVFFPDTTDVYDKKNRPKAIFCLHALSLYLYRMGVAPPIRDVARKAAFTSRHTDNTVQWLRAMAYVRFPEVFFPDTTDIYDKKSMPKAIFCLHVLSLYLYGMGVALPICDVARKAAFTSRHTDNTVQWLRAMAYVRFPEVFFPDTTDVYDKKNMPKPIICLHALSLYLYRMGIAPPICDVAGKVAFTSRHMDNTVQLLRAMAYVRFPEVFFPDTTDVYDKKNRPKAIFCLHALSLYLYRMGVAPPIRDVAGKAAFTSRHTDNTVQWLRAMAYVRFPEVFFLDTTDVYDKKNMPKAIFCLHALSLYLYRMGVAPPIRDVAGKASFTSSH